MKKTILIAFLAFVSFIACTKSSPEDNNKGGTVNIVAAVSVPAATTTAFSNEFSGATGIEWQRNSSSLFTVQFNHSNQRHSAGYNDNGHRTSHSIICTGSPVPRAVLDAFLSQFPTDDVCEWKLSNDGTWRMHIMRGSIK
jgi:hypothetical protein